MSNALTLCFPAARKHVRLPICMEATVSWELGRPMRSGCSPTTYLANSALMKASTGFYTSPLTYPKTLGYWLGQDICLVYTQTRELWAESRFELLRSSGLVRGIYCTSSGKKTQNRFRKIPRRGIRRRKHYKYNRILTKVRCDCPVPLIRVYNLVSWTGKKCCRVTKNYRGEPGDQLADRHPNHSMLFEPDKGRSDARCPCETIDR